MQSVAVGTKDCKWFQVTFVPMNLTFVSLGARSINNTPCTLQQEVIPEFSIKNSYLGGLLGLNVVNIARLLC